MVVINLWWIKARINARLHIHEIKLLDLSTNSLPHLGHLGWVSHVLTTKRWAGICHKKTSHRFARILSIATVLDKSASMSS